MLIKKKKTLFYNQTLIYYNNIKLFMELINNDNSFALNLLIAFKFKIIYNAVALNIIQSIKKNNKK